MAVLAVGRPRGPADYGRHREPRGPGRGLDRHRAERSRRSGDAGNTGADQQVGDAVVVVRMVLSAETGYSHVRWIACHPLEPERLWVAIEAGALVSTIDGGHMERPRARWTMGHPRARHSSQGLPIHCASRPATDISRVTMPVPRGARPPPASRLAAQRGD